MDSIGFLIKRMITFFVEPLGFVMTLFAFGLVFIYLRKEKYSKIFLSFAFAFLFLFSFAPFSNFLVTNLENQYPKYDYTKQVKYIHVLGGGHNTDREQPISSHLSDASTKRVLEGIIIHRKIPNSKLIFTGYAGSTNIPTALMNAELARELGVDEDDMIVNGLPKDTAEEAKFTKTIVGSKPFILVTSATHMPRSMMLFQALGMHPIAAPTYFQKDNILEFIPGIGNLENSRMSIHEYLGILWAKIKS